MIQHIVMWRLMDEANGKNKSENMELMREGLLALKESIPQIISLSVVKNTNPSDTNMDVALITTFENYMDLETYAVHPEHVKIARFIGSVRIARSAIDFEI